MQHQLVYISAAQRELSQAALAELLTAARTKNQKLGVGGLLIHHAGSFLQVLEGSENTVETLFRVIETDRRHRRVIVLSRQSVKNAAFSSWSMGFADSESAALKDMNGFRDFSHQGFEVQELSAAKSRAFYLIEAFSVGRLRQFVAA